MNHPTKTDSFRRLAAIQIETVIDVGVAAKTESLIAAYPHALHLLVERDASWLRVYPANYEGVSHVAYLMNANETNRIDGLSFDGNALLKIDVDGGELQVLRGATGVLNHVAIVAVEATSDSICGLVQFASEHSFRLFDIVELCYCGNQLHQCDLIFVAERFCPLVFTPWSMESYQHFE